MTYVINFVHRMLTEHIGVGKNPQKTCRISQPTKRFDSWARMDTNDVDNFCLDCYYIIK